MVRELVILQKVAKTDHVNLLPNDKTSRHFAAVFLAIKPGILTLNVILS